MVARLNGLSEAKGGKPTANNKDVKQVDVLWNSANVN
jgi:hypothetical protein